MTVFSAANPLALVDTSGATKICSDQNVTISSVGNHAAYEWNTGSTAPSIQVNQSGSYFVVVTDINGCNEIIKEGVNGVIVSVKNTDDLLLFMNEFVEGQFLNYKVE